MALFFLFISVLLTCGYAFPATEVTSGRIVGGELTTIEEYPSIVAVEFLNANSGVWNQGCGGSILTSFHILSAGHCFDGIFAITPTPTRVRAGSSYRNFGGQVVAVSQQHHHPSLTETIGYDGDIVVVRLERSLIFNRVVQPGTIIAQDFVLPDNLPVIYAGWGHTAEGGPPSEQLRDVTVYTINWELCRYRYDMLELPFTENMICTGILDVGGKDACQGDSGGPLYYRDAIDRQIIVGVVSWGWGCGNETFPGVATAVSSYTDWIIETVRSN